MSHQRGNVGYLLNNDEKGFLESLQIFERNVDIANLFFNNVESIVKTYKELTNQEVNSESYKVLYKDEFEIYFEISQIKLISVTKGKYGVNIFYSLPKNKQYSNSDYFLEFYPKVIPLIENEIEQDYELVGFTEKIRPFDDEEIKESYIDLLKKISKNKTRKNPYNSNFAFYMIFRSERKKEEAINQILQYKEFEQIEEDESEEEPWEEEFNPDDVSTWIQPISIDSIVRRISDGFIILNPDFQRNIGLWSEIKMSRFIESLLLKLPIQFLFFDGTDEQYWIIIDGLQRLSSLQKFILFKEDPARLRLKGLTSIYKKFNDRTFDELPGIIKRRLLETEITINILKPGTPPQVKYSIYHRMNTGGLVLNAQEIRNAISYKNNGRASRMLSELSKDSSFKRVIWVTSKRMMDQEIILRFFAFYLMPAKEYKNSMIKYLDRTMEKLEVKTEKEILALKEIYISVLDFSFKIFGNRAFSKAILDENLDDRKRPADINRPLYDVWTYFFSQMDKSEKQVILDHKESLIKDFKELLEDREFYLSITTSTTTDKKVTFRFNKIHELINKYLPNFSKRWRNDN